MKKTIWPWVWVAAALLLLLGMVTALWSIRVTDMDMVEVRSAATREVQALAPDEVVPALERMAGDYTLRARFQARAPFLTLGWELRVPADYIGCLAEGALLRFAGRGYPSEADQARIRRLVAFAEGFLGSCSEGVAAALRERLLDSHFIIGDFDGAVAMLEAGMPNRSEAWTRAAVAKVRAHQAEMRHDDAAALESFIAFGKALAQEPDDGVGECDPGTGIVYSRAWLLGKNAKRVADLSAKLGRAEDAARALAEAKAHYAQALRDAEKDSRSRKALEEEIGKSGL